MPPKGIKKERAAETPRMSLVTLQSSGFQTALGVLVGISALKASHCDVFMKKSSDLIAKGAIPSLHQTFQSQRMQQNWMRESQQRRGWKNSVHFYIIIDSPLPIPNLAVTQICAITEAMFISYTEHIYILPVHVHICLEGRANV